MSETAAESKTNAAEYTVSEISGALKRTVEDAFGNVRVRGEISSYRGPHSSGHAYFCLKDDRARIDAVVWRTAMARLKFQPEEGMEVIATGKLTTYPGKSTYQIVIDRLEPAGAGALMALMEERKRKLQAEGLFDASRKQLLPFLPMVIGVVTSPTGAVIRDIIHRIKDRFPLTLVVWPVRVQGETSGAEVAAAVAGFNALPEGGAVARPDLLIVARGGGSLEDLWGFNDEALVRAVAASQIPVISAVGHETDWTLIDLAADMRAPTPTGAAELAVPVKAELEARLAGLSARLRACTTRGLDRKRNAVRSAGRALPSADQLLALPRRRFDEATARLGRALTVGTQRKRALLDAARLTPAVLSRRIDEARKTAGRDLRRAEVALAVIVNARRAGLDRSGARLPNAARAALRGHRQHFARVRGRLNPAAISRRREAGAERLQTTARRLDRAATLRLEGLRARLAQAERLLSSLSHQSILERGFALVSNAEGGLIRQAAEVSAGSLLSLRFSDGEARAIAAGDAPPARPAAKPAKAKTPAGQGSLF